MHKLIWDLGFWILNLGSMYSLNEYKSSNYEIIGSAEAKRQKIIKSLPDTKDCEHHPESFYITRLLNESIQQTGSVITIKNR